jgi:hypothetical protein
LEHHLRKQVGEPNETHLKDEKSMTEHFRLGIDIYGPTAITILGLVALIVISPTPAWQVYAFHDGQFAALPNTHASAKPHIPNAGSSLPAIPADWHVTTATLADVTGDDNPEWVLLVWRPWRDWPIQEWSPVPSPITDFHDASGKSCHLILLDPIDGREIWAGSALPAPLLALATDDIDDDGIVEIVTLEGDYVTGRNGPAKHINVWQWNGFGFSLEWRSPQGTYNHLSVIRSGETDSPLIAVR